MTQCHRLRRFLKMARRGGGYEPTSATLATLKKPRQALTVCTNWLPHCLLPGTEAPAISAASCISTFEQRTQNTLNKCYGLMDRKRELRKSLQREGGWLRAPSCVKVLKHQRPKSWSCFDHGHGHTKVMLTGMTFLVPGATIGRNANSTRSEP